MEVSPYLHLGGQCEAALTAYAKIFGGKIVELNRFAGSPAAQDTPSEYLQKIMHASFEAPGVKLMASDGMPGKPADVAGNVSLSVATGDVAEGERMFKALAEGGVITMPYEKMFWGATFGMVTDAYGIAWMINAG
jgi:PhnB protein